MPPKYLLLCSSSLNFTTHMHTHTLQGVMPGGGAKGYYGGSSHMGQITPTGCMTPSSHGHTPIHYSSMGHTPYSHTPLHSHSGSGCATPHGPQDLSGIVTPDLDLPLDFSGLDDLPAVGGDNLTGFPQPHTPSTHTPHTHHYPPQQHAMHSQPHLVQNHQKHHMHSRWTR